MADQMNRPASIIAEYNLVRISIKGKYDTFYSDIDINIWEMN